MSKPALVAFLSDFGLRDSYVAEVKGVILSISSEIEILDITHQIEPQNVLQAALMLRRSAEFMPQGTVFLSVIDPGVGSDRRVIAVETSRATFIAPDNGLVWMTVNQMDVHTVVAVENYQYYFQNPSSTFEGRDRMAPVAAYSALGVEATQFGPTQTGITKLEMPPTKVDNEVLMGEIIYFDRFGNAITNISFDDLMQFETLKLPMVYHNGREIGHIVSTFSDSENGAPLAYFGSSGYLELAVNRGNFRIKMMAESGQQVAVNYG
jgi:hypothetical protein